MSHDPALVAKVADEIYGRIVDDRDLAADAARAVLDALDLPGRERRAKAEALREAAGDETMLDCECGHDMDTHNGLGCYARLSYEPLVTCRCLLTDDRTHFDLLGLRLIARAAAIEEEP